MIHLATIVLLQNIISKSVTTQVIELFVPTNRLDATRSDAESLPAITINKVSVIVISA